MAVSTGTEKCASEDRLSSRASLWRQRLSWVEFKKGNNNEERKGGKYYDGGLYLFAFVTTALSSGLCFGWPSLRRHLLTEEDSTLDERSLGVIFTIGAWTTLSCRFFYGVARDRWLGTRITTCLSIFMCAMGMMGLAFADANNAVSLSISMFFVSLGTGTQPALLPVVSLFRKNVQGLLLTAISGAFQVSGLVFVVLTAITTNRKASFASFASFLVVLAVTAAFLLPKHQFAQREQPIESANDELDDNKNSREDGLSVEEGKIAQRANDDSVSSETSDGKATSLKVEETATDLESPDVWDLMKTPEYIYLLIWFSVILIPLQYYVATIGYQLEQKGDDDGTYTRIFSITYASGAAVSPIVGKFTDAAGLGASQATATILCAISFFMLASYDISLNVHSVGMAFHGVGRIMVFGAFFTNVGKRFGYTYFGTLTGLGLFLAGLISLLQYPLISLATDGHDSAVNVGCAIAMLCLLPYCGWLSWKEWKEWKLMSK